MKKSNKITVIVSPLLSLMKDQIRSVTNNKYLNDVYLVLVKYNTYLDDEKIDVDSVATQLNETNEEKEPED